MASRPRSDVTSAPGAGSAFEILLPRMAEEQAGLT
jgi:hypothetical protein